MIEENEARQCLQEHIKASTATVGRPLETCLGEIAAKDVISQLSMPRFANAMVDGYALTNCPHEAGQTFRLIGEQPAGLDRELSLGPEETIRIFTGAPLPKGTEAVIMQEEVTVDDDGRIRLHERIDAGDGIRLEGDDLCQGQKIVAAGDRLTPQRVALLASQGYVAVEVRSPPRVRVLSTGDELVAPGSALKPGQLYESNGLMLSLLGEQHGWPGWTRAHIADDPEALRREITQSVAANDFLFLSGGVSVGDHDHVRPVLQGLGFIEHFWRVRVQPGKPVLFGTLGDCRILGLPGNPVSSFVSFHLFGVPAIHHWLGIPAPLPQEAVLKRPAKNDSGRPHYLRGWLDPIARTFEVVGLQRSHGMLGLSMANALARIPPESQLPEGAKVKVLVL